MRVSTIVMDDGSDGKSIWTKSGRGNKRPENNYPWDAVADYE